MEKGEPYAAAAQLQLVTTGIGAQMVEPVLTTLTKRGSDPYMATAALDALGRLMSGCTLLASYTHPGAIVC